MYPILLLLVLLPVEVSEVVRTLLDIVKLPTPSLNVQPKFVPVSVASVKILASSGTVAPDSAYFELSVALRGTVDVFFTALYIGVP